MFTETELEKIFKQKSQSANGFKTTTFIQFKDWHLKNTSANGCKYCGITNPQSRTIFDMQRNGLRQDATRGGKRSRRLEIDRLDPLLPYDFLNNLVWCCYWCNNAKSNFFTPEEFKSIAQEIGNTLRNILRGHDTQKITQKANNR